MSDAEKPRRRTNLTPTGLTGGQFVDASAWDSVGVFFANGNEVFAAACHLVDWGFNEVMRFRIRINSLTPFAGKAAVAGARSHVVFFMHGGR